MKRVVVISYAFPPLSVAGVFRPMRFAKYLPEHGWSPTIITVDGRDDIPRDDSLLQEVAKDLDIYNVKASGLSSFRILENNTMADHSEHSIEMLVERCRNAILSMLNDFISIPDPLIYWVPPVVRKCLDVYKKEPFDAIVTTSPPHSSHFAGLILAKCLAVPWIADFRDPWVDNVYFHKLKGRGKRCVERLLERMIISNADAVIANTAPNRDRLLARYQTRIPSSRITTITNGYDRKFIDGVTTMSNGKYTICHTGRFYSVLEPYFFFDSFARWIETNKDVAGLRENVQVLIVGSGDNNLIKKVHQLCLDDCVQFIPRVSHKEAVSYAKSADLLLVNLGFSADAKGWVPLKLYDYLGCARPILGIVPEHGAAAEMISNTKRGYVVSKPDHETIRYVLDDLYSKYLQGSEDRSMSSVVRRRDVDKYEVTLLTHQLAELLNCVTLRKEHSLPVRSS